MWATVFSNFFSLESLIALVVGVVGGMVIGALPGLNATMAISLLIPITYTMSPYAAFTMMMAVYTSAFYGGSLTAILIHTPGTPSSAATAGDGYALTQKGRGLEAMGMSTVASMIGGALSGVALLTLAPLLGKVTLLFSAPEYFLIVILGLSIIGGLGGGSAVKGYLMGVFGLILGTIGTDTITGQLRFTFGYMGLYSGISTVPALIGLFSISQAMVLCEQHAAFKRGEHRTVDESALHGKFLPTAKEMILHLPNFIRSAIIGIVVGLIGMLICRQVIKITKVSDAILVPVIVVLSTIGSYSINNRISDVYMMLVFGLIGYLCKKADLPTAPIILGLLLESTGEQGFKNAILMAKDTPILLYYLQRPASLVLILLIVATVVVPAIQSAIKAVKGRKA